MKKIIGLTIAVILASINRFFIYKIGTVESGKFPLWKVIAWALGINGVRVHLIRINGVRV